LLKNQDAYWSWNVFSRLGEELNNRFQFDSNRHPVWTDWLLCSEKVKAEQIASAFMSGRISAEEAVELSGLDQSEFALLVENKAQSRDLPIFQAYLKGEAVEDQLPFSEEASRRFKDLMSNQVE
jgi:predicted HTH domain antitoxin